MIETKILDHVEDLKMQETIAAMQCFGWTILNSQKIDYTTVMGSKGGIDAHTSNGVVYNSIESKNEIKRTVYWSLSFQRDTKIENYELLNDLNKKYDNEEQIIESLISEYYKVYKKITKFTLMEYIIIGFLCIFMGLGIIIYKSEKKGKEKNVNSPELKQIKINISQHEENQNNILNEAKQLIK